MALGASPRVWRRVRRRDEDEVQKLTSWASGRSDVLSFSSIL